MANRRLNQFAYSYERDLVTICATVTIAAAGVPTLVLGKGVKSVTRNSAGDYSIALQDSFNSLLAVDVQMQNATGIAASPNVGIKTDSVNSATAPLVRIVCSTGGAATDPASGDKLFIQIVCRNAST